ncbi:MAG: CHAT domain-containing protein [Crocinitomicaceae bacterium]|nr:CHAT domain-containing protein [Crocinitomicaceae bacterium]MBK8927764.1 CHAT domain-containing protein [Crocinitomicaceae bacterium]
MKIFISILAFFCLGFSGFAQSSWSKSKADSLWTLWKNETVDDTVRLVAMKQFIMEGYLNTKPDSAIYFANQHRQLAEERGSRKHLAASYQMMGLAYYNLYQDSLAIVNLDVSRKMHMEMNNDLVVSSITMSIGNCYLRQGETRLALEEYFKSLQIYKRLNDKSKMASASMNIGLAFNLLGPPDSAIKYLNLSLSIYKDLSNYKGIAKTSNVLGSAYKIMGNYALALEYYHESLNICIAASNIEGMSYSYNNLGNLCMAMGDYPRAYQFFIKCAEIDKLLNDPMSIASTYNNLGSYYENIEQYDSALNCFNQGYQIYESIEYKIGMAGTLWNIGIVYFDNKDYSSAEKYLLHALRFSREIDFNEGMMGTLNMLGNTFYMQDMLDTAINYFKEGLLMANESNRIYAKQLNLECLYNCYVRLENRDMEHYYVSKLRKLVMDQLELNFFALSEHEQQRYFYSMEKSLYKYIDFSLSYYHDVPELADTAFNMCLQSKSISLESSIALRSAILASEDSILAEKYNNWILLKGELEGCYNKGDECDSLEIEANTLERDLIRQSDAFSDFDKIRKLDWKKVQSSLENGQAAIEFVNFSTEHDSVQKEIYIALVVLPNSKHPEIIKLCDGHELESILGTIQGNNLSFVERVYGKKSEAKKDLYEKIWQPLEPYLQNVKTVYYSPSGLLHKVSFSAICKDQDVYLSDVYNFRQMGSTGNLAFENSTEFGDLENFLLMGGVEYQSEEESESEKVEEVWSYLPGSLAETNTINTFLKKKKFGVNYFSGLNASEEIFKEKISSSSIVHIATHGFFFPDPEQIRAENQRESGSENKNEDLKFRGTTNYANWSFVNNKNPLMRSGIVLANANDVWQRNPLAEGEDGILTAQEVSNLDLRNTKLVVLSACETGLGDIKGSEGVFGLQRAFKMAGVKYLIMSLWQVPDKETSEFMILFYKNLIKLKDIPTAFQKTQKLMREKYDPYYWGAFVLIE